MGCQTGKHHAKLSSNLRRRPPSLFRPSGRTSSAECTCFACSLKWRQGQARCLQLLCAARSSADVRDPNKTSQTDDCAARTDEEGKGKPQQSAGEVEGSSLTVQQSYQEIGSEERDPQDDRPDGQSSPLLRGLRKLLSMPKQHANAC